MLEERKSWTLQSRTEEGEFHHYVLKGAGRGSWWNGGWQDSDPEEAQKRLAVLNDIKALLISYIGLVLMDPSMFPQEHITYVFFSSYSFSLFSLSLTLPNQLETRRISRTRATTHPQLSTSSTDSSPIFRPSFSSQWSLTPFHTLRIKRSRIRTRWDPSPFAPTLGLPLTPKQARHRRRRKLSKHKRNWMERYFVGSAEFDGS